MLELHATGRNGAELAPEHVRQILTAPTTEFKAISLISVSIALMLALILWRQCPRILRWLTLALTHLVAEADLRYPIIQASNGAVMDGMHRVAKALMQSRASIDAVQFATDPAPDYVDCRPDELSYERPPNER